MYDKCSDCEYEDVENLRLENQELKKQLDVGEQQYNDVVEEKENLQEQLDYLRSGEYLNQLRFERDMLQHVVDNGKVSKEDKNFIDMAHRNTELLEENHKLKKQLETVGKKYEFEAKNRDKVYKMLRKKDSQQKEFIAHLEDMLVSELDIFTVVRVCDVLSKYKEIIGVKDE